MITESFPAAGLKNVIAIDSYSKILSVAVSNGKEIHYTETNPEMRHSELAMDIIDTLIKKASLSPCALQGVLCMAGPGSFTGLRIGYSIAKGLALSLSIPFAAIPTLDCIAFQLTDNNDLKPANPGSRLPTPDSPIILPLIEARKNSYFYAFYQDEKRLTPDKEADSEQIIREIEQIYARAPSGKSLLYLTGNSSVKLYDSLPQKLKGNIILNFENKGCANKLLHLANKMKVLDNDNSSFLYAGPEYVRESDAETALRKV